MGTWKSDAYQSYIRTSPRELVKVSSIWYQDTPRPLHTLAATLCTDIATLTAIGIYPYHFTCIISALCNRLASVARCLCTLYVDPAGITALVAGRLIALDKCPGVRPIYWCQRDSLKNY